METINTYYKDYEDLKKFIASNQELFFADQNHAVLVQVFSGVCEEQHLLAIARQIRELIPRAQVIGTTTSGEIMNGLVSGKKTVLSFSVFQHSDVRAAFAEKNDEDDYTLGQSIATTLTSDKARILILFATGFNISGSQLLKGVQSVNSNLLVAGGHAGINLHTAESLVLCNDKALFRGVAGVVLEGSRLNVACHSHLGWQPIGKEMTITKAEGSRVYTIDHIPAYQIYRQYLGITTDVNILDIGEFPLILSNHGVDIARTPYYRYDDDSIAFFGDIEEGEKVRLSFGHIEMILGKIDNLLQTIRKDGAQSIFVYSCNSRRGLLQESAQIETLPLQNIAPTSGFFTSGEFFHTDGSNQLLNTTMTTLVLSESADDKNALTRHPGRRPARRKATDQITAVHGNIANRHIRTLRALTFLVNTVTNELDKRTAELQRINEHIQHTGSHDDLTGLYNRNFFNQEMVRLEGKPVDIIMCDIDNLKFINDSFGHHHGDMLLQAFANIMQTMSGPEDVAARIGGDEFSLLLPNSTQEKTKKTCQMIRQAIDIYNSKNPTFPLSVSVGFACNEDNSANIQTLLQEADNKMYWEKIFHTQSNSSDLMRTLMRMQEARNIITEEKSRRLQDLFTRLVQDRVFPQSNFADCLHFIHFHDIGKIGISDQILFKPAPLTPKEEEEMQRHCELGYRIARSTAELHPIAGWILKHHEWWDGTGYPLKIKENDIPLECRILAILESYDDMTSDRPDHKALPRVAAIEEIKRGAGTHFDPILTAKFIGWIKIVK